MKRSIREKFLLWIGSKAGVREYEIMPKWLRVVAYIIMTERLKWAWEMRGYRLKWFGSGRRRSRAEWPLLKRGYSTMYKRQRKKNMRRRDWTRSHG